MNYRKIIKTLEWVLMNKDVLFAVERCVHNDGVLMLNKEYKENTIVLEYNDTIQYIQYRSLGMFLRYNFRCFNNGKWNAEYVYDLKGLAVDELSKNY